MSFEDEDNDFEFDEPDDPELEMELGRKDEDIYDEEGREQLVEDGEIEAWEAGFMAGAEGEGQDAVCKKCNKVLVEAQETVEKKIGKHIFRFCSELCATEFEEDYEEES